MLYWFCLAGAIALEIAGTLSMKLSQGFSRTAHDPRTSSSEEA